MLMKIDMRSLEFDGIHNWDYPDYCDAYIISACYEDATPLTDEELDELNEDSLFVHDALYEYLY